MSKEAKPTKGPVLPTILPEIRSLIEMSRHHAAVTANLALVNLYWNIGRIITQDIQKNEKRAGYGEQLLDSLAKSLIQEYGRGYSVSNLNNDMRRFYEDFQILQALPVKSSETKIRQTLSGKSTDTQILQALPVGSPCKAKFARHRLAISSEFSRQCLKNLPASNSAGTACRISDRILIDFSRHFHLGWTHYRSLLGIEDIRKRQFYFDQVIISTLVHTRTPTPNKRCVI